jgi:hypothetical protein
MSSKANWKPKKLGYGPSRICKLLRQRKFPTRRIKHPADQLKVAHPWWTAEFASTGILLLREADWTGHEGAAGSKICSQLLIYSLQMKTVLWILHSEVADSIYLTKASKIDHSELVLWRRIYSSLRFLRCLSTKRNLS